VWVCTSVCACADRPIREMLLRAHSFAVPDSVASPVTRPQGSRAVDAAVVGLAVPTLAPYVIRSVASTNFSSSISGAPTLGPGLGTEYLSGCACTQVSSHGHVVDTRLVHKSVEDLGSLACLLVARRLSTRRMPGRVAHDVCVTPHPTASMSKHIVDKSNSDNTCAHVPIDASELLRSPVPLLWLSSVDQVGPRVQR
jgi:hypothetical protein